MMTGNGKIAFITGAAGGIGAAIAGEFATAGYTVILTDLDPVRAEATAGGLRAAGLKAEGYACDVADEAELRELLHRVLADHGRIDVLVNNAGLQYVAPIEEFPVSKFDQMLRVMLTAPFIAIQEVFPVMKKQGYGRVINMASINGLIGFAGKAAYNSAKHGLIGLTKVAALEGALHGITVNAVCPGYVDTPLVRNQLKDLAQTRGLPEERVLEEVILAMVPQKRLLTLREIASLVYFLCGDAAAGITGQSLVIDGGYTAQ